MENRSNVRNRNILRRMGYRKAGMTRAEWLQKAGLAAAGVGAAAVGFGGVSSATEVLTHIPTGENLHGYITSANPGDTLLLESGGQYTLSPNITVDKSITIKCETGKATVESDHLYFEGNSCNWKLENIDWQFSPGTNMEFAGSSHENQRSSFEIKNCMVESLQNWIALIVFKWDVPSYFDKIIIKNSEIRADFVSAAIGGFGFNPNNYDPIYPNVIDIQHSVFEGVGVSPNPDESAWGCFFHDIRGECRIDVRHNHFKGPQSACFIGRPQIDGAIFSHNIFESEQVDLEYACLLINPIHKPPYLPEPSHPDGKLTNCVFKNNEFRTISGENGIIIDETTRDCSFLHNTFTGQFDRDIWLRKTFYGNNVTGNVIVTFQDITVQNDMAPDGGNILIAKGRATITEI